MKTLDIGGAAVATLINEALAAEDTSLPVGRRFFAAAKRDQIANALVELVREAEGREDMSSAVALLVAATETR